MTVIKRGLRAIPGEEIAVFGVMTALVTLMLPFVVLGGWYPGPGDTHLPGIGFVFFAAVGFALLGLLGVLPYVGMVISAIYIARKRFYRASIVAGASMLIALAGTFSYVMFHTGLTRGNDGLAFGYYIWFAGAGMVFLGSLKAVAYECREKLDQRDSSLATDHRMHLTTYLKVARDVLLVAFSGIGFSFALSMSFVVNKLEG